MFVSKSFYSNLFYMVFTEMENEDKSHESSQANMTVRARVCNKMVSFYSFRMLIIHLKSIRFDEESESSKAEKLELLDLYKKSHPFDSLKDYLIAKQKENGNCLYIRKFSLEYYWFMIILYTLCMLWLSCEQIIYLKENEKGISVNLIFTYSDLKFIPQSKKNNYDVLYVSTLNQSGEEYFRKRLEKFANNKNQNGKRFLMIFFSSRMELEHLNFICYFLKIFQEENTSNKQRKTILLLIRQQKYKEELVNLDIDFSTSKDKWNYYVIENLNGSFYK